VKLTTLRPRLATLNTTRIKPVEHAAGERPAGRGWQATRLRIQVRDRSMCRKCGLLWVPGRDAVDHIVPRWAGGGDDDSNLWLLHEKPCHEGKSTEEAAMRARSGYVMPEWVAALIAAHRPA
jgi:5-methylcytosine-specific restriction endonuclease McrA